ncbi:major facilitator superfamily domain-containing protein [Aspergillus undulatus]|uniref:major facilitator superfamily domain-containing protein n=1 Tax=Aspergillus undulatus TaxID=1810928 RepID=UPI003CCDD363
MRSPWRRREKTINTNGSISKLVRSTVDTALVENGLKEVDSNSEGKVDPKEERRFLWRLDLGLLTIGFIGYVFKYMDQININNAYVSGMQGDLRIYGNELNYITTYFNIGYMIMLFPSCILVSYIGPSIWLPACEVSEVAPSVHHWSHTGGVRVLWGAFTCCLSTVTKAEQVYGLRFLIGFFEGVAWPGYYTQWYLPHELALRMSTYNIAQPTGAMISGAMQGALATNLDGSLGRDGWRWAFLLIGVCTILVALVAFIVLPGYPECPNPLSKFYLEPRHIEIALARGRRVGWKAQTGITPKSFLRTFKIWFYWAIVRMCSVAMLNYLPIVGQAIQLVAKVVFSGLSDRFGRFPLLLIHSTINIASLAILIVRPTNQQAHMAGYYLNYIGAVSLMLLCSWASERLQDEPEGRTILFASGTIISYALNAFVPIAAFPVSEAPHWRIGALARSFIWGLLSLRCLGLLVRMLGFGMRRGRGRRGRDK